MTTFLPWIDEILATKEAGSEESNGSKRNGSSASALPVLETSIIMYIIAVVLL